MSRFWHEIKLHYWSTLLSGRSDWTLDRVFLPKISTKCLKRDTFQERGARYYEWWQRGSKTKVSTRERLLNFLLLRVSLPKLDLKVGVPLPPVILNYLNVSRLGNDYDLCLLAQIQIKANWLGTYRWVTVASFRVSSFLADGEGSGGWISECISTYTWECSNYIISVAAAAYTVRRWQQKRFVVASLFHCVSPSLTKADTCCLVALLRHGLFPLLHPGYRIIPNWALKKEMRERYLTIRIRSVLVASSAQSTIQGLNEIDTLTMEVSINAN